MSQGKFSSPRPHREEEREIEKAYRDLTRKKSHKKRILTLPEPFFLHFGTTLTNYPYFIHNILQDLRPPSYVTL